MAFHTEVIHREKMKGKSWPSPVDSKGRGRNNSSQRIRRGVELTLHKNKFTGFKKKVGTSPPRWTPAGEYNASNSN